MIQIIIMAQVNDLISNHENMSMTTRAAARGEQTFVNTASRAFHGSFLPCTIRDTRRLRCKGQIPLLLKQRVEVQAPVKEDYQPPIDPETTAGAVTPAAGNLMHTVSQTRCSFYFKVPECSMCS